MAYVTPPELASKMIDAGQAKVLMSTRDTLIRAFMAGAILALAAAFAVTITVNTKEPLLGALLFPVGLCIIVILGLDLVTGAFGLVPLPSRWRIEFCPPVDVSTYGPEAASDRRLVLELSDAIREQIQAKVYENLIRREGAFL